MDPVSGRPLASLLHALPPQTQVAGPSDCSIVALAIDSRSVRPGSLFVALRGEHTDGHRFIGEAAKRGASAVVAEDCAGVPPGVTAVAVPDSARALSQIAAAFFDAPSEKLLTIGVTGTNGKTTTTQMVAAILGAGAVAAGVIGTIGARFGDREWPISNTTPLALELQDLLAQMRERGAKAVAMEVSSHALALQRVADVHFRVAALTNITRDHLDFHKTFESYAAAKRILFDMAQRCVLNTDDEIGERWARELRARKPVLTYALGAPADLHPDTVEVRSDGSTFHLSGTAFEVRIPGRFNIANALCAIAASRSAGVSDSDAARGLAALERVAGRMERMEGDGVGVIVDYAHTPDALENVLVAVRETTRRRLVLVFGCGGDRDRGKRPQMGAVAARYADYTYVTSDNPRTEDPQEIVAEIVPGLRGAPHAVRIDRRIAIEEAIAGAQPGDIVVIAGKGHEDYQIIGADVIHFDDREVAREALGLRRGGRC